MKRCLHCAIITEHTEDEGQNDMTGGLEANFLLFTETDLGGDVLNDSDSGSICRIRRHFAVLPVQPEDIARQEVCMTFVI